MTLGERIRAARKAAGLSQGDLGKLCGWEDAQSRVSNYENGKREPTLHDLEQIADRTGIEPGLLAFGRKGIDEAVARILSAYALADKYGKQMIVGVADVVISQRKAQKTPNNPVLQRVKR